MKRDEPVEDGEAPPEMESARFHEVDEFDSDESTLELGGHEPGTDLSQGSGWVG